MKIGIYTITEGENYGNRLQNYAMQCILESKNNDVRTLRVLHKGNDFSGKIKLFIKKTFNIKYSFRDKRKVSFDKFNKKYIKFESENITDNGAFRKLNSYDCFVAGSDQIWNPNFDITTGASFLQFAKGKRKVSISASFGVDSIEDKTKRDVCKKYLNDFNAISVREKAGAKIVKELINVDVPVLIDPTLMLGKEQWKQIAEKPKMIDDKKYILCYLLGNFEDDVIKKIKMYCEENQCKLIFLDNDYAYMQHGTDDEFAVSPSEFIWLIEHCEKVITDSFHAIIFSMIFQKRLIAIPRDTSLGNMNNRLTDLAEEFRIKNLISYDYDFSNEAEMDFDLIESVLTAKKKQFINFLDKNLKE